MFKFFIASKWIYYAVNVTLITYDVVIVNSGIDFIENISLYSGFIHFSIFSRIFPLKNRYWLISVTKNTDCELSYKYLCCFTIRQKKNTKIAFLKHEYFLTCDYIIQIRVLQINSSIKVIIVVHLTNLTLIF